MQSELAARGHGAEEGLERTAPFVAVRRRIRLRRGLSAGVVALQVALGLAALVLASAKLGLGPGVVALPWLPWLGFAPPIWALAGAARHVPVLQVASALDQAHGLHGLLASATEFDGLPLPRTGAFERACIARARAALGGLSAAGALPLAPPPGIGGALGGALVVSLLASIEPPAHAPVAQPPPTATDRPLLQPEDMEAEQDTLRRLLAADATPTPVRAVADELNDIIEAMAAGRIARSEALRAIGALEQRLREATPGDPEQLQEALRELGASLQGPSLARPIADALSEADARAAAEALRALADELPTEPPDSRNARLLQQRLKQAAQPPPDSQRQRAEAEQQRKRLLDRQRKAGLSERERQTLQRKRRELQRLQRQQQAAAERRRQLEALRRALGEAAAGLGAGDRARASQGMRSAGAQAQRLARQQAGQAQAGRLQAQMQDVRELLRRSQGDGRRTGGQDGQDGTQGGGQDGQDGQARPGSRLTLSRFGQAARGQKGQAAGASQPGQEGQPGQGLAGGGEGEGEPGRAQDPVMRLRPAGDGMVVAQLQGASAGGDGAGEGGDVQQADEATANQVQHRDSALRGTRGQGPTRSEVILEAAARGFASRDYERVHAEYERHAERALARDHVPGGYRFYVRRYFQLIRGREESP